MAIYSKPVSENRITGSRKGITLQRAGTNFIIRKRAVIVQKRSTRQSFSKSLLATRSQVWRSLTAPQQASWLAQVGNYTRLDSLGNPYDILANQLQIWTNVNAELNNDSPILSGSAPIVYPTRVLEDVGFSEGASIMEMTINNPVAPFETTVPVGFSAKVFFTAALSPGSNQPPDFEYKLIEILPEGTNTLNYNYYPAYLQTLPPLFENTGLLLWSAVKLTSLTNYIDDDFIFSPSQGL